MNTATSLVGIENPMGIHLRPASSLVQVCNRYPECEVELRKDEQTVNGKSIMGVIMLAAQQGSEIEIKVSGEECENLLAELVALCKSNFGED